MNAVCVLVCVCVCACVPAWLTSELRLSMLWRAGHPVELFSAMPEEFKAASSPSLPRLGETLGVICCHGNVGELCVCV